MIKAIDNMTDRTDKERRDSVLELLSQAPFDESHFVIGTQTLEAPFVMNFTHGSQVDGTELTRALDQYGAVWRSRKVDSKDDVIEITILPSNSLSAAAKNTIVYVRSGGWMTYTGWAIGATGLFLQWVWPAVQPLVYGNTTET